MTEPKIYSFDSSLLPDANPKYGFCVDLVRVGDYASLKAERDALQKRADALAVENAGFKHALSVILEHVDVTDKGQAGVVAMIANDELFNSETPATDAALAAIEAQGVEKAASALDALSAQSASATTQANFRAAAVYLRAGVLPVIGEAK
ncbi:TPA: hypothetical protein ACXNHL_002700 [Serratia marcescens]